ncbi:hypothetical protein F9L06_26540, partial [Brucella anthropi]
DIFDKDMVRAVAEAGIWGSVRHHGLLGNAVIISDDAGQFRVGVRTRAARNRTLSLNRAGTLD